MQQTTDIVTNKDVKQEELMCEGCLKTIIRKVQRGAKPKCKNCGGKLVKLQATKSNNDSNLVRKISDERIKSFGLGLTTVKEHLAHMITGQSIDLTKSKSDEEKALAERISMEPRRQSVDENNQFVKLNKAFKNVEQLCKGSMFLDQGKFYDHIPPVVDPADLDGRIKDDVHKAGISCKHNIGNGGAQNYAFRDLVSLINEAPKNDTNDWLILFVDGSFWTKLRKRFLNYQIKYDLSTTKKLLTQIAEDKKVNVMVLSTNDLPKEQVDFFAYYGLNK